MIYRQRIGWILACVKLASYSLREKFQSFCYFVYIDGYVGPSPNAGTRLFLYCFFFLFFFTGPFGGSVCGTKSSDLSVLSAKRMVHQRLCIALLAHACVEKDQKAEEREEESEKQQRGRSGEAPPRVQLTQGSAIRQSSSVYLVSRPPLNLKDPMAFFIAIIMK